MNFIFFILSLIGLYLLFPVVIGFLVLPIPNSLINRAPRLQTVITSLLYGFLLGSLTTYFMSKPFVRWQWLYILCGVFMAFGLPYRIESISSFSFDERDAFFIASIWIASLGGFVLTLIIL